MSESNADKDTANPPWWRRHLPKIVIVLIAPVGLVAVRAIPSKQQDSQVIEAPPVNVKIITVKAEKELSDGFVLPAVVEPNRIVTISAEVGGRIETLLPEEGDTIRTGQVLMKINTDLLKPALDRALAQVKRDEIGYERMKDLVESKSTSQQDLDDAAVKLSVSRANLAEMEARLERTQITSPTARRYPQRSIGGRGGVPRSRQSRGPGRGYRNRDRSRGDSGTRCSLLLCLAAASGSYDHTPRTGTYLHRNGEFYQ